MSLVEKIIGFGKQAVEGYTVLRRDGKLLTDKQVKERVEKDLLGTLFYTSGALVGTVIDVMDDEVNHFRKGYRVAEAKHHRDSITPLAVDSFERNFSDRTSYDLGVSTFNTYKKLKSKLRGE